MSEGIDLLVAEWGELRADLTRKGRPCWTASHLERAANLLGIRVERQGLGDRGPVEGGLGRLRGAGQREGGGLDDEARRAWVRARLVERIDEAVAELEAHRETLDLELIELDRAEAGDVAWFDPSREASLARRYESESQRNFFKSLKELRRVEAEAAERPAAETGPVSEPSPAPAEPGLASSREEVMASSREGDPLAELAAFDGPIQPLRTPPPLPFRVPRPGEPAYEGTFRGPEGASRRAEREFESPGTTGVHAGSSGRDRGAHGISPSGLSRRRLSPRPSPRGGRRERPVPRLPRINARPSRRFTSPRLPVNLE